jgi:nucleotide-binding universal stress UspA family protein
LFEQGARRALDEALSALRDRVPRLEGILRMGVPWEEILKAIAETHADLVVMGTHGRRGISHALIGSVAEKVVRASPVPVLSVHAA